jgi:hypothetical protein
MRGGWGDRVLPMFPGLERAEQERVAEVAAGQLVG